MMIHRSWRPPFRAMCPAPGPRDQFLVILINGKRVSIQHADEYDRWREAAERLAGQESCNVKVLPMTGSEMLAFVGVTPAPPKPIEDLNPADREHAINACMDVLRECNDQTDRKEALDLLNELGVRLQ